MFWGQFVIFPAGSFGISYFSRKSCSILVGNDTRNQNLGAEGSAFYWGFTAPILSVDRARDYINICKIDIKCVCVCVYIYLYLYLYI